MISCMHSVIWFICLFVRHVYRRIVDQMRRNKGLRYVVPWSRIATERNPKKPTILNRKQSSCDRIKRNEAPHSQNQIEFKANNTLRTWFDSTIKHHLEPERTRVNHHPYHDQIAASVYLFFFVILCGGRDWFNATTTYFKHHSTDYWASLLVLFSHVISRLKKNGKEAKEPVCRLENKPNGTRFMGSYRTQEKNPR